MIGDIHGAHKALLQVLERSGFDKEHDTLVCLGDVVDGWPEVCECIDELLSIKNLEYVLGNHDEWFQQWWKRNGVYDPWWLKQGGQVTYEAYGGNVNNVPPKHRKLFDRAHNWYTDGHGRLFLHGGLDIRTLSPRNSDINKLRWDRELWSSAVLVAHLVGEEQAMNIKIGEFDEIFIGHTATTHMAPDMEPVRACNVYNLDQGAGWDGKLTIMDVETKEFWQSDVVTELYPGVRGRATAPV